MESRRGTRSRPTKDEKPKRRASPARTRKVSPPPVKKASPVRRASPSRTKSSPVRRSSRPRSTITKAPPSPIKDLKISKDEKKSSPNKNSNLPATITTNTSSRAPIKSSTSTSSVHSSYSSSTQKTVEIRSSAAVDDKVMTKIKDYLRRSVSKTIGDTRRRRRETDEGSRSASRSIYDEEFSDEEKKSTIAEEGEDDENEHYKSFTTEKQNTSSPPRRQLEPLSEFGGKLGISLLLLLLPLLIYYLQWTCGKSSCGLKTLHWQSIDVEKVFNKSAIGAYWAIHSVLFILTGVLTGISVSSTNSKKVLNFNALPIAILVTIAAGVAEYLKYPVADFVLEHYLHFCIYGLMNAFIVSFWCYLRSEIKNNNSFNASVQLNPYSKGNSFIVRFGLGHELSPRWFDYIDYKQAFYRISLIVTLFFAECFLYKKIQVPSLPTDFPTDSSALEIFKYYAINLHYDAGAVFAASMLLVYVLDSIIFEHHLASSFELQGEGFGCLLLIRYFSTPFLLSAVAKYFYDRRMPTISCQYAAYVAWTLLVLGLILKRLSNAIKYKYRIKPTSPHFKNIETIHTYQGCRLLLGSFWGRIRQPNYAGDILALIALTVPLYLRFSWPPLISISLIIILLLHRTVRVNSRNISRYHSSWVRYCTRVPNYLVPKIF